MAKNFISNKDETVRMFENDFLEALSKVHYTVPLYIFLPVIAYFLYKSIIFSLKPINNEHEGRFYRTGLYWEELC